MNFELNLKSLNKIAESQFSPYVIKANTLFSQLNMRHEDETCYFLFKCAAKIKVASATTLYRVIISEKRHFLRSVFV